MIAFPQCSPCSLEQVVFHERDHMQVIYSLPQRSHGAFFQVNHHHGRLGTEPSEVEPVVLLILTNVSVTPTGGGNSSYHATRFPLESMAREWMGEPTNRGSGANP